MKKIKKILFIMIIGVIVAIILSKTNIVKATDTNLNLGITLIRKNGNGYVTALNSDSQPASYSKVWKIKEFDSNNIELNNNNLLYCIKAGAGFGSGDEKKENKIYTQYFDFRKKDTITGNYAEILNKNNNNLLTSSKYNQLMWVIDHMYTQIGENNEIERNNFLKNAEIPYYGIINDDDIDVVQQLAIWHYTNTGNTNYDKYYKANSDAEIRSQLNSLAINSTEAPTSFITIIKTDSNTLIDGTTKTVGEARIEAITALYEYFIKNADATYNPETINENRDLITYTPEENDTGKVETISGNYISGPYKISDNDIGINYSISAFLCSESSTNADLTDKATIYIKNGNNYEVLKDTNNQVITNKITILEQLKGREFYIGIPITEKINGISTSLSITYNIRKVTYWSVKDAPDDDQPVIKIEDVPMVQVYKNTSLLESTTEMDFSLRKFITKINDTNITNRIPEVDITNLNKVINGTKVTTATYNHTKDPIRVSVGDIVTYTIRVYNEGSVDGYVSEITDYLPEYLEFIVDEENAGYGWKLPDASNLRTVKTNILAYDSGDSTKENLIEKYTEGKALSYKDVKIKCKVIDPKATDSLSKITSELNDSNNGEQSTSDEISVKTDANETTSTSITNTKITNIAEVTDFQDENGNNEDLIDRDSQKGNIEKPTDDKLPNYKDDEIATGEEYIPGQQDDDDFEKLQLKAFDLSLRKFITKVNDTEVTSREPKVDLTKLNDGTSTTATYNHSKNPIKVELGDTVIYTIRVYNEGEVDGYVNEITDHLPEQLEYLTDNEINKKYEWKQDTTNKQLIKTEYLSKANDEEGSGENKRENKILAFDGTTLSYKDVQVACKIAKTEPMVKKITNIADITAFVDANGNAITDRDSTENNVQIPTDLPTYRDDEISKSYVPGQEDDDDFEKLVIGEFDLSLRKFITKVNTSDVKTRIPQVDASKLKDGSATTATYTHTKEPVLLCSGDIVTYTIRVYNEGDVAGFANEIKDDIPEGLLYISDNDTNKEYRWIMLDKDGNETDKLSDAVSISTDYLSKEQGEARMAEDSKIASNPSLISAFDSSKEVSETNPSYVDVKVAFKVIEPDTSDRIIINKAQISKDEDENGQDITDRDSTPDKWNEGEDDQDIEKVKVQYFDLSLRKWVTEAIVNDNGNETVTETGHKAEDNPESIVKVELKSKKMSSVIVKFRYKIRVTNEGTIAGYVKEIKDYIPSGLMFNAEDNPLWQQEDDKIITTDQAKDILLQPGESTEVEVLLTWINGNDNLGVQDNYAEISKDYNEYNSPDIDSTPNNKKEGEDDIDDAPVILSIQTGQAQKYIVISGSVLIILISGIALIKKFII